LARAIRAAVRPFHPAAGKEASVEVSYAENCRLRQITTHISLPTSPETGRTAGSYLIRISSPIGAFTPFTKALTVTQPAHGQSASGQVVCGGSAVSYAIVTAMREDDDDDGFVGATVCDASGNFTLSLPAGSCTLLAAKAGYLAPMSLAPSIDLTSGETLTGQNPELVSQTCAIAGKIRNADDLAVLPGVQISTDSNDMYAIALSDANGDYSLPVIAGQWEIEVLDASLSALGILKPGDEFSATTTAGATTTLDMSLTPAAAMVYGTVRDPLGNPIPGVKVEAGDDPYDDETDYEQQYDWTTFTDADGKYFIGVSSGVEWRIEVNQQPAIAPHVMPPHAWVTPAPDGATLLDFNVQAVTAHIRGTVTKDGVPLAGIVVGVSSDTNDVELTATTDATGAFDLGVVADTWWIGLEDESLIYAHRPPVSIGNGQTIQNQNFEVLDPTGTITGTVVDPYGNPFTDEDVYAYTDSGTYYEVSVEPNSDGSFSLPVLAGIEWWVGADGCDDDQAITPQPTATVTIIRSAMTEYPENQSVPLGQNATFSVTVDAPSPTIQWQRLPLGSHSDWEWIDLTDDATFQGSDTATLSILTPPASMSGDRFRCVVEFSFDGNPIINTSDDARLTVVTAHIRGHVTLDGAPIVHLPIVAGNTLGYGLWIDDETGTDGSFDLGISRDGTWHLGVDLWEASERNLIAPYSISLTVSDSNDIDNVTIPLRAATGGLIVTVVDEIGNPVEGAWIWTSRYDGLWDYGAFGTTDADGQGRLPVTDGEWTVNVTAEGQPFFLPKVVTVSGSATVNFSPPQVVAEITGGVFNSDAGVHITGARVNAYPNFEWPSSSAVTDTEGNFALPLTSYGEWAIQIDASWAAANGFVAGSGAFIDVAEGSPPPGVDLQVRPATGTISGHVYDEYGLPVANAPVWGDSQGSPSFFSSTQTDENGFYSLPVIDGVWWVSAPEFYSRSVSVSGNASLDFSPADIDVAVSPSSITSDHAGNVTLSIAGLPVPYQTVRIERILDLNSNGSADSGEPLVQSFEVTDGIVPTVGGVRNPLIPGDEDGTANNAISAFLSLRTSSELGRTAGNYIIRISGSGLVTESAVFQITQPPTGQSVSGQVVTSSGTPLAYAVVRSRNTSTGTVADATGNFTLNLPAGDDELAAIKVGYFSENALIQAISLGTGQNLAGINPVLSAATAWIHGRLTDSSSGPLPGVQIDAQSDDATAIVTTDADGRFTVPANEGSWEHSFSDESLAALGVLNVENDLVLEAFPEFPATIEVSLISSDALLYGTVRDPLGNPMPNVRVEAWDDPDVGDNTYEINTRTDADGRYFIGITGGPEWRVAVDGDQAEIAPHVMPDHKWINTPAGTAYQLDFATQQATAHIQGTATFNSSPLAGVEIWASNDDNDVEVVAITDSNGAFDLGVIAGGWYVGFYNDFLEANGLISPSLYFSVTNEIITGVTLSPVAPSATITGNVTDAFGNPLEGMNVFAFANVGCLDYVVDTDTDTSGHFSLAVINAATWSVGVDEDGFEDQEQDTFVVGSAQVDFVTAFSGSPDDTTVNAGQDATFSCPASAPSPTIQWERLPHGADEDTGWITLTDDATYSDTQTLSLTIHGAAGDMSGDLFRCRISYLYNGNPVTNVSGWAELTVVTAHIRGRVTKNGTGVAGLEIGAGNNDGNFIWHHTDTDADGFFDIGISRNGTWHISVDGEYAASYHIVGQNLAVQITNNEDVNNVAMHVRDATGTIGGHVVDENGQPLTDTGVWGNCEIDGKTYFGYGEMDDNGNFSFPVIDGTWTVGVNSPEPYAQQTVTVSGSATVNFSLMEDPPFTAWQEANFSPAEIASGWTGPTADFDNDGLPNLLEYAFRKNPKAHDAAGITPDVNANTMSISFPCDATCTDIIYTVQASSNLSAWEDIAESVGGAVTVPKNGSGCTISDTGTGLRPVTVTEAAPFTGRRFLRVRVSTP